MVRAGPFDGERLMTLLFVVSSATIPREHEKAESHVVTLANNREQAKRHARPYLGGNPDEYIVSPLVKLGGHVDFVISSFQTDISLNEN